MERNRQKPVGRHKGSLTEQQTEGTGTTTVQVRRKHDKTDPLSWTAPPPRAPEPRESSRRAAPTGTQRDVTGYGIPSMVWPGWGWVSPPGCAPSWILVKINPVLAKPRTIHFRISCSRQTLQVPVHSTEALAVCQIKNSLHGWVVSNFSLIYHQWSSESGKLDGFSRYLQCTNKQQGQVFTSGCVWMGRVLV